ncbi:MAG: hypothetical protein GOMPHAMPRED_000699 [Gomphillus americanus]|uniref:R3H domain-containing protein n=1 Tax=Gomphillus americanus TaxID=1940652 RepID=A0A8H3IEA3_9LECA|nr:MAG: hypothetical protein GOMPHAMPRED_000699 [Gomphillus americanus]
MNVLNSATKDPASHVGKLSLKKSAVTVGELFYNHRSPVAPNHRYAGLIASVPGLVVILRLVTIVMETTKLVQNVHSWLKSLVCVASVHSRINLAFWLMFVAVRFVGASFVVALTFVANNAIVQENARMQDNLAPKHAGKTRRVAAILVKILVMHHRCHLKTETRCLASRSSEGNTQKTLKCDDECARLERNRRLALALNIDPATHQDDHVPYTSQTLQMYQEFPQWAQVQEKELRIFAADVSAKRLRFKPMTPRQRSFLHSLSEDFGFDSESMDPEPYRHVAIFKTPKFVAAPMKTLADCVRIRTVPASTPGTSSQFASDPFNGFLLTSPQFGLTVDELRAALQQAFSTAPTLAFDISFLPDESVVLKAKPSSPTTTISPPSLAASLRSLKAAVSAAVASQAIAGSLSLCTVDTSLNVTRKESDQSSVHNGWSQVAAKAASGMKVAPKQIPIGVKSSYVILGQKAKKKEKQEESKDTIADDWEEEMRREEEAEGLQNADLASA